MGSNSKGGDGIGGGDGPRTGLQGQAVPELEYPTDYAFKVIGRAEADFSDYVRVLFARMLGEDLSPQAFTEQPSRQGTYVSVEVRVRLVSEEQRRAIYGQLHQEKRIVLYL